MASKRGALVVFGASGFVGSAIAQEGVRRGLEVLCLSRKGIAPKAFAAADWAKKVMWASADALKPETYREKLEGAEAVIVSIGSPPLPFVDRAYQVWQLGGFGELSRSVQGSDLLASRGDKACSKRTVRSVRRCR